MQSIARNRLTEVLANLEREFRPAPAPSSITFGDGRYRLRVAGDEESRAKAYRLIYGLYLKKEYAQPNRSGLWLSLHDAQPGTLTLLVERTDTREAAGALTIVFDSPLGLPADKLYKSELDALRAGGRKLSEIISLGVAEDAGASSEILVKLFSHAYLVAHRARGSTDFVITVNPRHVRFYERTLLFEAAGPERSYDKVGGAPALLLRLDFAISAEQVRLEHGPAETKPARSRTLYASFLSPAEEPTAAKLLSRGERTMTESELRRFFVEDTDIFRDATPAERAILQEHYLAYDLWTEAACTGEAK